MNYSEYYNQSYEYDFIQSYEYEYNRRYVKDIFKNSTEGWSSFVLTLIGGLGNFIVFYVFTRQEFLKQSFFRYLLIANIFDSLNGILVMITIVIMKMSPFYSSDFVLFGLTIYPLQAFSAWHNVIISMDTYLLVKFPTKFKFRKTLIFQIIITLIVLIISFLFNLPLFKMIFFKNYSTRSEWILILTFSTIMDLAIPFILMIIFNSLTFRQLALMRKRANQNGLSNAIKLYIIMLVMDFLFLISYLPNRMVLFLDLNLIFDKCACFKLFYYYSYLLQCAYYFFDFFVYFISNKLFRKYCLTLVTCHVCKK